MGVDLCSKPIVIKICLGDRPAAKINCLHHATRRQNAKHGVHVRIVRFYSCIQRGCKGLVATHIQSQTLHKNKIFV